MQHKAYGYRNESGPYAGRIKQHVDRMLALQMEVFEEGSRKRGPPETTDGLDNAKRARLAGGPAGAVQPPPLPKGPVTYAQLYTLTPDEALKSFDVTTIPLDLVIRITLAVLQHLDSMQLDEALNLVRSRYVQMGRDNPAAAAAAASAGAAPADDDDDYEPDFEPEEDREQVLNKLDMAPPEEEDAKNAPHLAIGAFKLPQPPPVTPEQAVTLGNGCVGRVFGMVNQFEAPEKTPKSGFNRLAGSRYDREAWVTVMTRLATRAHPQFVSEDKATNGSTAVASTKNTLGDGIRQTLWQYVIDDFRRRIDVGIMWLNEEWYNDKITTRWAQESADGEDGALKPVAASNYETQTLRVLDTIAPYLDAGDKLLIRFLGEIPEVTQTIMDRVKRMAKDPDRISLAVKAL